MWRYPQPASGSFGGGIRRCLGVALAMAEQRVMLEAMARRHSAPGLLPTIDAEVPGEVAEWLKALAC